MKVSSQPANIVSSLANFPLHHPLNTLIVHNNIVYYRNEAQHKNLFLVDINYIAINNEIMRI